MTSTPTAAPHHERRAMYAAWLQATLAALVCAAAVAVAGAAIGVVAARNDPDAFAGLGWFVAGIFGAVVVGLLALGWMTWWRLRARAAPYAGQVGLAAPVVAALLGFPTGGLGAVFAVPVAWWLVRGLHAPARPGWGTSGSGLWARWQGTGVWQRVFLAVAAGLIAGFLVLEEAGRRLGGRVDGSLWAWALAALAAAVPAVVLLVRRAWPLAVALPLALAVLFALAAPDATRSAHPTQELLAQQVDEIGRPAGTSGQQALGTLNNSITDTELPVIVATAWDDDAQAAQVPLALTVVDGRFPRRAQPVRADDTGRRVAQEWAGRFADAEGWEASEPSNLPSQPQPETLPDGTRVFDQGLWVKAYVVPVEGGAVLVVTTRP